MRGRNEEIHLYILDQDRQKHKERVHQEAILSEWLHRRKQPAGARGQQRAPGRHRQPNRDEITSLEKEDPQARRGQGFCLGMTAIVDIEEVTTEPMEARTVERGERGLNPKVELGVPAIILAWSLTSTLALLLLDTTARQDPNLYGLQSSLAWVSPYWIAIRAALEIVTAVVVVKIYLLRNARARRYSGTRSP